MPQSRPQPAGVQRPVAWAPIHDPVRNEGFDPGSIYGEGRQWTPFGLSSLGHTFNINVTTGGLEVTAIDLSLPYQATALRATRVLDVRSSTLRANISTCNRMPTRDCTCSETGNSKGKHSSLWCGPRCTPRFSSPIARAAVVSYRQYSDFDVNTISGSATEDRLRAHGVPGRTLSALAWQYSEYDCLLRTLRGSFTALTGGVEPETIVDPIDAQLWAFDPVTGVGRKYTSEYAYQQFIDVDGRRETNVQALVRVVVDALGHAVSFIPVSAEPPYRTYRLLDGAGRAFRFELGNIFIYLDRDNPGGQAKTYFISEVIDETRADWNVIEYKYDQDRLSQVIYPGQSGGGPRIVKYDYNDRGYLESVTDPTGGVLTVAYLEDLLDSDTRLIPRLKVSQLSDSEGNSVSYQYDHPQQTVVVTIKGPNQPAHRLRYTYSEDDKDTGQRYLTSERIDVTLGQQAPQAIYSAWEYTEDGRFLLTASIDPLGQSSTLEYNSFNQLTASVDANTHRRDFKHDVQLVPTPAQPNRYDLIQTSESNVDAQKNKFPVQSSSTYRRYDGVTSKDAADTNQSTHRTASHQDELGRITIFDYNEQQNYFPLSPTQRKDPLGNISFREYDASGNLLRSRARRGSREAGRSMPRGNWQPLRIPTDFLVIGYTIPGHAGLQT